MIDHAIQATKSLIAPPIFERLQTKWAANAQGLRRFLDAVKEREDPKAFRRLFILRELLRCEFAESSHIYARATKRPICPEVVRKWTRQIRLKTALVPL